MPPSILETQETLSSNEKALVTLFIIGLLANERLRNPKFSVATRIRSIADEAQDLIVQTANDEVSLHKQLTQKLIAGLLMQNTVRTPKITLNYNRPDTNTGKRPQVQAISQRIPAPKDSAPIGFNLPRRIAALPESLLGKLRTREIDRTDNTWMLRVLNTDLSLESQARARDGKPEDSPGIWPFYTLQIHLENAGNLEGDYRTLEHGGIVIPIALIPHVDLIPLENILH